MTTPTENQARVAAFEAGAEQYVRMVDKAAVLGWLNQDEEFELRLPNHYDDKGVLIGEGGCMRVKKRDYLCRDLDGNYTVYSDAVFQKTHQRFIPAANPEVIPMGNVTSVDSEIK